MIHCPTRTTEGCHVLIRLMAICIDPDEGLLQLCLVFNVLGPVAMRC